jgi:hypothetical protein
MALMAFQFENAAIRIESGSNVILANIASKAVVQVATALSSQGTAFGRTRPRRQADRRQGRPLHMPILPSARCRRGAGFNEEERL